MLVLPGGGALTLGATLQLSASPKTSSGIDVPGRSVAWSSNTSLAEVSSGGLVTARGVGGPVTITATVDGEHGTVTITVIPVPVDHVTVDPPTAQITEGETVSLAATPRGADGAPLAGRMVLWSSANDLIAMVNPATGLVLGNGPGGPIAITATVEGKSGSAQITVLARPASRLAFQTQPPDGTAGQALSPAVQVAVQDEIGGVVGGATTAIILSLSNNPGGATLGGTLTRNAVNGVATFPDLTLNRSGIGYVLTATATALSPVISNPFDIGAGAAARLALATPPSAGAISGAPLAQQPVVQLQDANGNPVAQAGVAITAAIVSGTGTLGGTLTMVTNAAGAALFTNLAITGQAGVFTLRFSAAGLTAVESGPITIGAGNAATLALLTQPSPAAQSGVLLAIQPVVELRDGSGNPVAEAGTAVTVTASAGGSLAGTTTVQTDAQGRAVFTDLILSGLVGDYTLSFNAAGLTGVTSDPIALAAGPAAALEMVTQPSGNATNGQPFGQQPAVRLVDDAGNPVSEAGVSITVSIATGGGATLGGTLAVLTDADGVATFTDLVLTGAAGLYTLGFASPGLTGVTSATIALGAGGAAGLAIAQAPSSIAQSGVPLAQQPIIQLVDQSGNPVGQAGVTVTAALASGPGTLGGTLMQVTDASGRAFFTDLAITGGSGVYTISFSAPGFGTVVSGVIGLGAGVATQVVILTQPSAAAQSGVVFAQQPVVELRDASDNPVALAGVDITVSIASGAGTLGGTLTVATDLNGVATFTDLMITGLVGDRTLQFAAMGLTPAVSNTITLSAGVAAKLAITTQPSGTVRNDQAFPTQPVVQLQDGAGNPVAQAGVNVAAAIASGGGVLGGTLTAVTNGAGAATFTDLKLTGLVGIRTLGFSSGALTPATSNDVNVIAGTATQIIIITQPPASIASGATLAPNPVVDLQDVSGNDVDSAGVTITVALASGAGTLSGTFMVATAASGRATFTDLKITGAAGDRTLGFSGTALTGATSTTVNVTAGTATQLSITTQPSAAAQSGVAFPQQPAIQLRDADGNPVSQAGVLITAVIQTSPGGVPSLANETATTNASGLATFVGLAISGGIGNYTLQFTAAGLTPITSNTIVLSAGPAAKLTITVQPPPAGSSGDPLAPATVLRVQDAAGNNVDPDPEVAITATLELDAGGALSGTTVVVTTAGAASFGNLIITGASGDYTLRFSGGGLIDAVSSVITLGAGAPSKLGIATQPSASVQNGQVFPQQPVIQLLDGADNPVAQAGVTVTASILSGGPALGGTLSAVTDAMGVAAFVDLSITGLAGKRTLLFGAVGFVGVESDTVEVTAGAKASVEIATPPSAAAQSGIAFAQQPAIQLVDQSGNPVSEAGVLVTATIATSPGGTPTLSNATATTDGTGLATFAGLAINGTIGNYTLTFTGTGVAGQVTSGTIVLTAGNASKLSIATPPSADPTNGEPFVTQPAIQLLDAADNPVSQENVTINAAIATFPGGMPVLSNPSAMTNAGGLATFAGLTLTGTAGNYTIEFSSAGLTSITSGTLVLGAGVATKLTLTTAPSAAANNTVAFPQQPALQLRDQSDNAVAQAGVTVNAVIEAGPVGGALSNASAVTTGAGLATFVGLSITGTVGTYTLRFEDGGLTPVSADVALEAGPADHLEFFTPPPASTPSGADLAPQPVVRVLDASDNPVSGVLVTASVSAGGTLGGDIDMSSVANGRATFTDLSLSGLAGGYTLSFGAPGVTSLDHAIMITAGAAAKLAITTQPSATVQNDEAFPVQPVLQVQDAAGNPVNAGGLTVTAAIASGAVALGGDVTAVTDGSGTATFTDLKITGLIGVRTIQFTEPGTPLTPVTSNNVTVEAGTATQIVIITQPPANIGSGAILVPNPVVDLQDVSGNDVDSAGVSIIVELASGDPALAGTLTQATTGAEGRATFDDLTITGNTGDRTLRFLDTGLTPVISNTINVTAGAASKVTIETAPSAAGRSSLALAQQPTVQLRDAADNPVLQNGVQITAIIATNPGGTPTLASATAMTDANGLATFADLAINGLIGDYTLTFTGDGVAGTETSGLIALTAGPATQLAITTQPSASAQSDSAFAQQPVIQLLDAAGNDVDSAGASVTASLASGGVALDGTLTVMTDASGVATFPNLEIRGLIGDRTLSFDATSLTGVVSNTVNITAGDAAQLALTVDVPASAGSGETFAPSPVVQLQDGQTNAVAAGGIVITAVLATGGPMLGGTAMETTDGTGAATFDDLHIDGTVGDRTIQFSSGALTPVTSGTVNISVGLATHLAITVQPPANAVTLVTLDPNPVVELRDSGENVVTTDGTDIDVTLLVDSGAGAFTGGSTTTVATTDGVSAFSNLAISSVLGTFRLQFTSAGLTQVISTLISIP